jgi:hypothetical protein
VKEAGLMTMVFVSYGRENHAVVRSLTQDLVELGHTIWFDQDLTGGRAWWDHILSRIRECDVFVVALSPESLDSEACKRECSYAFKLGKTLLPVLIADVRAELLPPLLAEIQYVDYRRQDKGAAFSLMKAFSALPPGRALPEPLPEPPPAPVSYLGGLKEQIGASRPLSFEEQTALLLRLKQGLQDSKNAEGVLSLLSTFRAREDLFARVADEIDQLLSAGGPRLRGAEEARPAPPPPRVKPDSSAAADPGPAARVMDAPVPARGRFVRFARWLFAVDECREYRELQRAHWAAVRERPSFGTAFHWLLGDTRQYVLIVRVLFKLLLVVVIFLVLMALGHK